MAVVIALAMATGGFRSPAASANDGTTMFAPLPVSGVTARSVFVLDSSAGTPLLALNPDEQRAPASLTKLMTALVVVEHGDLDTSVTIAESDLAAESESRVGLVTGDTLTARDLLAGLLIPSGNDAARALARTVGLQLDPSAANAEQSTQAFVAEMNATATRLGAVSTHFVNPTGLDEDGQLSSARDIAVIGAAALQNPLVRADTSTVSMTLKSAAKPDGYLIHTTNDLLVDNTVQGGKTGTTDSAGGCVLTYFTEGRNLIVAVVLGSALEHDEDGNPHSPARFDDMRVVMSNLTADFRWVDPVDRASFPGLSDELAAWDAVLAADVDVPVPTDSADPARFRLVLGPAAAPDKPVGTVRFFSGPDLLVEQPVLQGK